MKIPHAAFALLACSVTPNALGLFGYCAAKTGIIGYLILTFLSYFVSIITL